MNITGYQGAGRHLLAGAMLAAALLAPMAMAAPARPLQAVPTVDLARYQGRWYQIALYPNAFQKQCAGHTTADYALDSAGLIKVTNQCRTHDGKVSKAVAQARIRQPRMLGIPTGPTGSSAMLEVRFAPAWLSWLPQVWAPYWVIQLADDYRYAVVGEPGRAYLWILSRTPTLAAQDRATINGLLQQQGYDPSKLQEEDQSP
jgi:apolipoprotein D and lipocalin family protein